MPIIDEDKVMPNDQAALLYAKGEALPDGWVTEEDKDYITAQCQDMATSLTNLESMVYYIRETYSLDTSIVENLLKQIKQELGI